MMDIFTLNKGRLSTPSTYSPASRRPQWIDIVTDDKAEVLKLADKFPIHLLTLEDCMVKTRSKIDQHTHYLFIVTKYIKPDFKRVQNNFILYENTLISIRNEEVPYFDNLKRHPKLLSKLLGQGIDFVLHELLDRQIDLIFPIVDKIEDKASQYENKTHVANDIKVMEKLFRHKTHITLIQKTIRPLIEITAILKEKTTHLTSPKSKIFFQDIHDHTLLISSELNHTRETILSTINMILAFNSDKMNQNMKILTIVTTILMPLTLITGIYGMNFKYMPEIYWAYGYPVTMLVMLGLGIFMLYLFKRHKWI